MELLELLEISIAAILGLFGLFWELVSGGELRVVEGCSAGTSAGFLRLVLGLFYIVIVR